LLVAVASTLALAGLPGAIVTLVGDAAPQLSAPVQLALSA
jgi:hypothetical protein